MARQVLCPVLATDQRNLITQTNLNSLVVSTAQRTPGTRVSVSCYVPTSHTLRGPAQVVCSASGQWSPSTPTCVRRSSNTNSNGGNNGATTDDSNSNNSNSKEPVGDSTLSNYSIIIITLSATFVLILIVILLVVLCRYCCCRHRRQGERSSEKTDPVTLRGRGRPGILPRSSKVDYVRMDTFSSPYYDESVKPPCSTSTLSGRFDVYRGPGSSPSWHHHPIITSYTGSCYGNGTWSELSVDRYLKEMATSRRENPRHSWRDFTSISSFYSSDSVA